MRFETTPDALARALKMASKMSDAKSTVPALRCARIMVEDRSLVRVDATDLYMYVSVAVAADAVEDGEVVAPANALAKTAERMPRVDGDASRVEVVDGSPDVGAGTNGVSMMCAGADAQIAGVPADEFPAIPEPDASAMRAVVPQGAFREALAAVGMAACSASDRASLCGVAIETGRTAAVATLVATDGRRLHVAEVVADGGSGDGPRTVVVPIRAATALAKLLRDIAGNDVSLTVSAGWLHVGFEDGTRFGCKLVDAEFPQWRTVLPRNVRPSAPVEGRRLDEALARAQSSADDAHAEVLFRVAGDGVEVLSRNAKGAALDRIGVGGPPDDLDGLRIGAAYLRDALAAVGIHGAMMSRASEGGLVVVRNADGSRKALVMPIRAEGRCGE